MHSSYTKIFLNVINQMIFSIRIIINLNENIYTFFKTIKLWLM
jgi:hypothetical protein